MPLRKTNMGLRDCMIEMQAYGGVIKILFLPIKNPMERIVIGPGEMDGYLRPW